MSPTSNLYGRFAVGLGLGGIAGLWGILMGLASPWFALPVAFLLLGFIDLSRPYRLLRLPEWLSRLRAWERRGTLYRALGVHAFGRLLRGTPLRHLNRRVYRRRGREDLTRLHDEVARAEAAHVWATLLTLPYLAVALVQGWWSSFFALMGFHGWVNIFPVLHLRCTRARLEELRSGRCHLEGNSGTPLPPGKRPPALFS